MARRHRLIRERFREAEGLPMAPRPLVAAALAFFSAPFFIPDLGATYENADVGFSFKPIKEWGAVPPSPNEKYQVVGWVAKREQVARKQPVKYTPEIGVLVFRPASADASGDAASGAGAEHPGLPPEIAKRLAGAHSFAEYVDDYYAERGVKKVGEPKKREINKTPCAEWTLMFSDGKQPAIHYDAYVFTAPSGLEVAVVYTCMDEWFDGSSKDFDASARSFKFTAAATAPPKPAAPTPADPSTLPAGTTVATESAAQEQKRFLDEQIKKLPPGWKHFTSKKSRYLILYDAEDDFVKKLALHLEAMRDYYETVFVPDHKLTATSIVRVCKNEDTYHSYGGPSSTGGYWAANQRELVVFQDKKSDQLATFGVVGHEAFHQYIYYFYGELDPHSWYNEGHGDYFSGAAMSASGDKVLEIKPYKRAGYDRKSVIQEAVRTNKWTPFKKFMAYSQREYYGASIDVNYAQGWSIVYFLRNGKKEGATVDEKWTRMLDDYLKNLVAARDQLKADGVNKYEIEEKAQQRAYDATFGSWTTEEWTAFETAWKKFYGG
jgi:hypothetical protein